MGSVVLNVSSHGRWDGCCGHAAVSQRKPVGELASRFVGAGPIEGHHRRRHARGAVQLSAPPVADGRNLDLVHAATDGFFEAMNGQLVSPNKRRKRCRSYAVVTTDQAKGSTKARSSIARARRTFPNCGEKYFYCQILNSFCTHHPQFFHNGNRIPDPRSRIAARVEAERYNWLRMIERWRP